MSKQQAISGKVVAVCLSPAKGTAKSSAAQAELRADHGLVGDAHAGNWHRQVSLLSWERVEAFRDRGAQVADGAFGENIVVAGIDFRRLPLGTRYHCGGAVLEMTQIGKECHHGCAIFQTMGDCIMPREGVFCRVLQGGLIRPGDTMTAELPAYRVAIVTVSDKGAAGQREDLSGPVIRELAEAHGYTVSRCEIIPDEREQIAALLAEIADQGQAELILTTGGTGFSPRDVTPEATADVAQRLAPGIGEAMRAYSLSLTKRAMLSRAIAAIRGQSLIVNLPGSPKAVRETLDYILDTLDHGLDILTGRDGECAR